jgi:hypothetical protein
VHQYPDVITFGSILIPFEASIELLKSPRISTTVAGNSAVEKLTRLGYVVHGLLYIIIGGLAAGIAAGVGGALTDPPGAIEVIGKQPFGKFGVLLTAIGLAAYGLWRLIQAVTDPDEQGCGLKGAAVRIGRIVSGAGYTALAFFAAKLSAGTVSNDEATMNWAERLLTQPSGPMLGTAISLIVLGVAVEDIRKACTARFGERLKASDMTVMQRISSRCAGVWGFGARAVVLCFAATFLLRAAWRADPGEVKGLAGVLASIFAMPHGDWMLGAIGLGLAAYGLFMMLAGRYRRHPY